MHRFYNVPYNMPPTLTHFTIFGERCSGTNLLEYLICKNFNLKLTWDYGWKHFFGFKDLLAMNTEHCIFFVIYRDPYDWVESFFKTPHHVPPKISDNIKDFISSEWMSIYDMNQHEKLHQEIMEDRNIESPKERYENICEMRTVKSKYLLQTLPNQVENIFKIKYETLRDYPAIILTKISEYFHLNMIQDIPITPDFDARVYNNEKRIVIYKKPHRRMNFETRAFLKRYFCPKTEKLLGYEI